MGGDQELCSTRRSGSLPGAEGDSWAKALRWGSALGRGCAGGWVRGEEGKKAGRLGAPASRRWAGGVGCRLCV